MKCVISWCILSSKPPPTQPFLCDYAFSEKTAAEKQAAFLIVFLV